MAAEISNRLKRSLGCSLPSPLAFEYPTLEALNDSLAMEVLEIKSSGDRREEIDNETVAQLQVKKRVENLPKKRLKRLWLRNSKIQAIEEYGLISIKEEDY
jgi:hypothetical protein